MMKKDDKEVRAKNVSRRRALKFAGPGVIAGAAGLSGSAHAAAPGMKSDAEPDKSIAILVDFPDTDYGEVVMKNMDHFKGLGAELLMRQVAYIDRDKRIQKVFSKVHPHEQRSEVIVSSALVITPCMKTVMASLKLGATPIYIKHEHSPFGVEQELTELGVNVVAVDDRRALLNTVLRKV